MNKQLISELVLKINTFPSLPVVVSKVLEVTSNSDSSIENLMDVIVLDQTFALSVLKAANSAFYGRVSSVSSLKEAITVLGRKEIRNIVITKAMFNRFKDTKKSEYFDIKSFWKHSFYCGLIAKIIAIDLGEEGSDFFIAGLIHDIGKLIVYFELPDDFLKIMKASDNKLSRTFNSEFAIIGTTHDRVGEMLLKKWMFPENLLSAVRFHHNPFKSESNIIFPILINIADDLAYYFDILKGEIQDEEKLEKIITPELIEFFKSYNISLNLSKLQNYIEKFAVQKEEASGILNLMMS